VLGKLGIAATDPAAVDRCGERHQKRPVRRSCSQKFPTRVIAGMICFSAFFGIAIGLGAWLPNIMNGKGFSITKSLQYVLAMNFAVPCASLFMMYALDKFGRKITSVCAFIGAGIMAIVFANADDGHRAYGGRLRHDLLRAGGRQFDADLRVRGVPDQCAGIRLRLGAGVGRLATAFIMPMILWIQNGWGLMTVFGCLATFLLIAAVSVTQLGPESRQKGLDEVAAPTG
jgi:putative MFS transporter